MDDEAVLLINHQSTSDVPVVMAALHNKGLVLGKIMWIMDDIFKYTNFGWISYFHGDFFILQVCLLL
jgi:lysophosphatidylglycerol acyltransferase 1